MQNKVIKNIHKFNDIKLAKGIDLNEFSVCYAKQRLFGASTYYFGKFLFKLPEGTAIFKTYNTSFSYGVEKVRAVNEMLCYYLCQQIGMPCAKYEPAYKNDIIGVVSYNVLKENEELIDMHHFMGDQLGNDYDFSLVALSEAIDEAYLKGIKIDKYKALNDAFKLFIFDILTWQTDRNSGNMYFINNNNTYTISPMIDNEMAFLTIPLHLSMKNEETDINSLIDLYCNKSEQFFIDSCSSYYNSPESNTYKRQLENLNVYLQKYPHFKQIVKDMLSKIDINKAFEQVEKHGYIISEDYKNFVNMMYNISKQDVKQACTKKVEKEIIEDTDDIFEMFK